MIKKVKKIEKFKNLVKIKINNFNDYRGYFEVLHEINEYKKIGITNKFIQDSVSFSYCNVLRGLHFQLKNPFSQLVTVLEGKIVDVVVDLRKNSNCFGKYYKTLLSKNTYQQIYIPKGFAHGFLVLSKFALLYYKADGKYIPSDEAGIVWNDKNLNIKWNLASKPIVSKKDLKNKTFLQICKKL
tara:strand:- start:9067 stop:9618 length:552 start_codon:yes stop_codon:yes gene_type:complete